MPAEQTNRATVIAEFLGGRQGSVVVHPGEFLIIVKDGKLQPDGSLENNASWDIIRTEGRHKLREGGLFANKPDTQVLLGSGSEYSLEFWTPSAEEIDLTNPAQSDNPILSQDGIVIPINFTISIAVDQDNAFRLFLLQDLRESSRFTVEDMEAILYPDLMGNVVAPTVAKYRASELRGNQSVHSELLTLLQANFSTYLAWYGIGLSGNQLAVQWGLNENEVFELKQRKLLRQQELARIEGSLQSGFNDNEIFELKQRKSLLEQELARIEGSIKWGLNKNEAFELNQRKLLLEQELARVQRSIENDDEKLNSEVSNDESNPPAHTNTGVTFENTGHIGGNVRIEQRARGNILGNRQSSNEKDKPHVFRGAIAIFGIIGGLGSGIIFLFRLFDLL